MNTKQTSLNKIMYHLRSRGGMLVDIETAPANAVEYAEKEGLKLTNEKTGKCWIYVESLF